MAIKRLTSALAIVATCLLCVTSTHAKKPSKPGGGGGGDGGSGYTLITLAPPGVTITGSHARDLDQAGNVVGFYDSAGQSYGFYYNLNQDDWLLFGAGIKLTALNNFGEMVGFDQNTGDGLHWRSPNDQNPATLSPLLGDQAAAALRINDAGIIIGESYGGAQGVVPVAWTVDDAGVVSAPLELPRWADDASGSVHDLNEADQDGVTQIIGASGPDYPGDTALRWEVTAVDGVPVLVSGPSNLGSLDGAPSVAHGINFFGDIVGQSGVWPFLKRAEESMEPLTGIRKATDGFAMDVNDGGVVVGDQGYLSRGRYVLKAVLWTAAGSVQELDKKVNVGPSETLESAVRINNSGQIIGSGFFPGITSAGDVGFLLVPSN